MAAMPHEPHCLRKANWLEVSRIDAHRKKLKTKAQPLGYDNSQDRSDDPWRRRRKMIKEGAIKLGPEKFPVCSVPSS